jgi:hypothetical protein
VVDVVVLVADLGIVLKFSRTTLSDASAASCSFAHIRCSTTLPVSDPTKMPKRELEREGRRRPKGLSFSQGRELCALLLSMHLPYIGGGGGGGGAPQNLMGGRLDR